MTLTSPGRETDSLLHFSPLYVPLLTAPPCLHLPGAILHPCCSGCHCPHALLLQARLWLHVLLAHRSLSRGHPKLHTYLQGLAPWGQRPLLAYCHWVVAVLCVTSTSRQHTRALQTPRASQRPWDPISQHPSASHSALNITPDTPEFHPAPHLEHYCSLQTPLHPIHHPRASSPRCSAPPPKDPQTHSDRLLRAQRPGCHARNSLVLA